MTRPVHPGAGPSSQRSRPHPTRPTPSRASTTRHTARQARRASRQASPPIPSTVWACGLTPIDPDAIWPVQLVGKIVRAFSLPGSRVLLLPWPAASPPDADRPAARLRGIGRDRQLAAAMETSRELGRTIELVHLERERSGHQSGVLPVSRPFWADLVGVPDTPVAPDRHHDPTGNDPTGNGQADADLIVTSYRPQPGRADLLDAHRDRIALTAARRLRVGGILAVLTHCDSSTGTLLDPTGPIVASAQNADLLYLQHIAALHHPVHDGQLTPDSGDHAAAGERDETGSAPIPHRRISSDLLVFAQPRDYQPATRPAADSTEEASR